MNEVSFDVIKTLALQYGLFYSFFLISERFCRFTSPRYWRYLYDSSFSEIHSQTSVQKRQRIKIEHFDSHRFISLLLLGFEEAKEVARKESMHQTRRRALSSSKEEKTRSNHTHVLSHRRHSLLGDANLSASSPLEKEVFNRREMFIEHCSIFQLADGRSTLFITVLIW